MNELVSIIVPIYNVSEYLEKCIMSLVNQTYKNIEIVLVNDGSTDNSLDICKKYETEDKRVVLLNKANGGLSDARNYGIERAKGQYITCVDSDDYVTDDYVEFMYNNLQKDDADISICKHIVLFDNNTQISTATHKKYILNPKDTLEMLLYDEDMDVSAVAKLYKKELFEGMYIPTTEDWKELKDQVMKYGIYNAYRLAIAPNQSTSYIMNSTASVMPIVDTIEVREYGDSKTFYPMPYLTNDNFFFYKSAYDMDQKNVLKLMSVIQRHVDQGISIILHTKSSDTTRDISKLYIYAHKLGLKSLYYTRTRKATIEECISCSV